MLNKNEYMDLLEWVERVKILEELTDKDINEMLAVYVMLYHIDCDKCPLSDRCKSTSPNCDILWRQFLEGEYES